MPKNSKPRSSLKRVSKEQQVNKAREAAAQQEVAALAAEVDLRAANLAPAEEKETREWEALRDQAIDRKSDAADLAPKYHSRANALHGKPLTTKEKDEHNKNVKRQVRDNLQQLLATWEDTLDSHEMNVEVGIGTPEDDKAIDILRNKIKAGDEVLAELRAELGNDDEEEEEEVVAEEPVDEEEQPVEDDE